MTFGVCFPGGTQETCAASSAAAPPATPHAGGFPAATVLAVTPLAS